MMKKIFIAVALALTVSVAGAGAKPPVSYYNEGTNLYNAGRFSEAMDSFENAIKHKEKPADAQRFIERIRKETVERIRNRALTGVSKTSWQNKAFFIRSVSGRV